VFEAAIKDLARGASVQILVDKKVNKEAQTPVSLQLKDVPLETAVRLLCEQADLKPVRIGNILYITAVAKAKELRSEPDQAPFVGPGFPGCPPPAPAFGAISDDTTHSALRPGAAPKDL
jgi:hypothetical protein